MENINWNDPEARLALIERVGPEEYNRLLAEYRERTTVETVNGHAIRRVSSAFGPLYAVGDTGVAYRGLDAARKFARETGGAK